MARLRNVSAIVAALAMATALPMTAQAQGGGGFGGPGGGFGRGFGQGGGFFGPREVTLASTPLAALVTGLNLNDEQKTKVEQIQTALRTQMQEEGQAMRQNFQGGGGGGFDPQAMREAFQALREKMTLADSKASKMIEDLLLPDQKKAVPDKIAEWKLYQSAGLPIDLGEELKLSADQKKALAEYVKKNPRPQGGPGGFGGPGGGGGRRRQGGGAPGGAAPGAGA